MIIQRDVDLDQIELYPLNSQVIGKLPPHIVHRGLRRLYTRVVTHEDVLELLQLWILIVLHRLLLRNREQTERFKVEVQEPLLYRHGRQRILLLCALLRSRMELRSLLGCQIPSFERGKQGLIMWYEHRWLEIGRLLGWRRILIGGIRQSKLRLLNWPRDASIRDLRHYLAVRLV